MSHGRPFRGGVYDGPSEPERFGDARDKVFTAAVALLILVGVCLVALLYGVFLQMFFVSRDLP